MTTPNSLLIAVGKDVWRYEPVEVVSQTEYPIELPPKGTTFTAKSLATGPSRATIYRHIADWLRTKAIKRLPEGKYEVL